MKSVITVIRMFALVAGAWFLQGCLGSSQKQTTLIPKDYIGKVAILYNQKDGQKEEHLNDRRIYRIPNCGILKTQFTLREHLSWALHEIDSDVVFIRIDNMGNPVDTLLRWPWQSNSDSENDFFLRNPNRVGIIDWGFCGFSFGDTENYKDVEFFIVDSFKNASKYSHPPEFEKTELNKCK
ncbi:MAG: hypothetical protein JNM41_07310 [Flavipsychrobacter sp.]|nr:hypothetical protein [Flavipsychrobacter sp.]